MFVIVRAVFLIIFIRLFCGAEITNEDTHAKKTVSAQHFIYDSTA
jgi:hypothetical protein